MSWNYRIGCKTIDENNTTFGVVEAYYEDGKIVDYTGFVEPYGEDREGLKWTLERMLEACDKEVLNLDELRKEVEG